MNIVRRFKLNEYPEEVIYKNVFWTTNRLVKGENNKRGRKDKYCELPFCDDSKSRRIDKLLKRNNITPYYRSANLARLLGSRRVSHILERANVVYLFECKEDTHIKYIGMTTRKLRYRIKEHQNQTSPVGQHILICPACTNSNIEECFSVLAASDGFYKLRALEAIFTDFK